MIDYSTKIYKTLLLQGIILLFLAVPLYSQTDWTLPLKECWSINESAFHVASDNDSKTTILFSQNSIKSINPKNGETLWENRHNFEKFSDIFFFKNQLYFLEFSNNKTHIHSIDIYSGLSVWQKEIANNDIIFLYRSENKILVKDKNNQRFYVNVETGQEIITDISLSNIFELFWLEAKFFTNFNGEILKLTYQGKNILENSDSIKKNIQTIIPLKYNTFIWSTNNNFMGVYDFISKKNLWQRKIGGQIADIKVSGNTIYISSFDNFVYLLSSINGKFLLKRRLDGRVTNTSEIFEDRIAVSAYSSNFITIFNLKKNKVDNILLLSDAKVFAVHQAFVEDKLIIATPSKVLAFSPNCK